MSTKQMYLVIEPAEVRYNDTCKECGQDAQNGLMHRAAYGRVLALVADEKTLWPVLGKIEHSESVRLKVFEFLCSEVDLEELYKNQGPA